MNRYECPECGARWSAPPSEYVDCPACEEKIKAELAEFIEETPDEILRDLAELYVEKNDDYGNSWEMVGEILYLMAGEEAVTIESPEDWIRVGLYVRRLDKFLRAFHGEFVAGGQKNFEAIKDSHEDDSVYAAMHASTHEPE